MNGKELNVDDWRHALAPWSVGGRTYTYLLPPGLQAQPGDTILVEGPQGHPKYLRIEEITAHEPTAFSCKSVALVIPAAAWAEGQAQKEKTGVVPQYSMHPQYPEWKQAAADLFAEGN